MNRIINFPELGKILLLLLMAPASQAQDDLGVARYSDTQQLLFPENTDTWIHLGSSLGGDYQEGPFDPANPGTIGVVTMETTAYRYFVEHGEYADGTMFLLEFYPSEAKSSPQLAGFVQGDLGSQEIHVVDSKRFGEGHAFYLYQADATSGVAADKIPDNSPCILCHVPEGEYNATFIQFYPTIRDLPRH